MPLWYSTGFKTHTPLRYTNEPKDCLRIPSPLEEPPTLSNSFAAGRTYTILLLGYLGAKRLGLSIEQTVFKADKAIDWL